MRCNEMREKIPQDEKLGMKIYGKHVFSIVQPYKTQDKPLNIGSKI